MEIDTYTKLYTTPTHEHTCPHCIYMGTVRFEPEYDGILHSAPNYAGTYDLYACVTSANILHSLIARFGDGPNYLSGLDFGRKGIITPLAAAWALAAVRGFHAAERKQW